MDADAALDLECLSARDVFTLTAVVRDLHPRDPLRALEDAVLDLIEGA